MYLLVHHLDWNQTNNDPKNLIVLCNKCHANIPRPYGQMGLSFRVEYNGKQLIKDNDYICQKCGVRIEKGVYKKGWGKIGPPGSKKRSSWMRQAAKNRKPKNTNEYKQTKRKQRGWAVKVKSYSYVRNGKTISVHNYRRKKRSKKS